MRLLRKKGVWVYGYVRYIFLNVENRILFSTFRITNQSFRSVNSEFFGRKPAETVFFFTFPLVYARFFLFGDVFPEVKPYTNLLYYLFFAIDNI